MESRSRETSNGEQRTVNRVQLAAVLLEYDEEVVEGQTPFTKASSSAVLAPYRHILLAPSVNQQPAEDYDEYFETVISSSTGNNDGTGRPSREGARTSYNAVQERYARSSILILNDQEEDQLTEEWGMKEYLSALGSGTDLGGYANRSDDSHGLETKSLPDLISRKETFDSSGDPGTTPMKIRLVGRLKSQPSYSAMSAGHESNYSLPAFDTTTPAFLSEDPTYDPLLARPRPRRTSTFESNPRPKSKAYSTNEEPTIISRRLSVSSLTIASRLAGNGGDGDQESLGMGKDRSRAGSISLVTETEPIVGWTSRFDPSMLIQARAEIESERPVFQNKDAGSAPKLVTMPIPLSGRPPSLFKRERLEGPGEVTEEEVQAEIEEKKIDRPAGTLFGRSLLDIMADRQQTLKSQQRYYVAQPQEVIRTSLEVAAIGIESGLVPPPKNNIRKSRSTFSVFGPDLFYQKDLEKVRALELAEAEELRLAEEKEREAEAAVWKKAEEKSAKQAKKTKKLRSAAQRKLEGTHRESTFTGPVFDTFTPARKQSLAPSISIPFTTSYSENWFAPPEPTHSRSSSDSSTWNHKYDSHRPQISSIAPQRPVLVSKLTEEHARNIREAVMMGTISPEEAAREEAKLKLSGNSYRDETGSLGWNYDSNSALPPQLGQLDITTDRIRMSMEEKSNLASLGIHGSRAKSSTSSDDDKPLGERYSKSDDDLPLAFHRAPEEDDDQPLAFNPHVLHAQQQQQRQQQQQQQQHAFNQAMMQQQMFNQMQSQQFNYQQGMMMNQQNDFVGEGSNVDRWRNGVS